LNWRSQRLITEAHIHVCDIRLESQCGSPFGTRSTPSGGGSRGSIPFVRRCTNDVQPDDRGVAVIHKHLIDHFVDVASRKPWAKAGGPQMPHASALTMMMTGSFRDDLMAGSLAWLARNEPNEAPLDVATANCRSLGSQLFDEARRRGHRPRQIVLAANLITTDESLIYVAPLIDVGRRIPWVDIRSLSIRAGAGMSRRVEVKAASGHYKIKVGRTAADNVQAVWLWAKNYAPHESASYSEVGYASEYWSGRQFDDIRAQLTSRGIRFWMEQGVLYIDKEAESVADRVIREITGEWPK
jgi:hypothetical protein